MRSPGVVLAGVLGACTTTSSEPSFTAPLRDLDVYDNDGCLIDATSRVFCWGDGVIFPDRLVQTGPENECVPPFTGPGGVFSSCYAEAPLVIPLPADDYVDVSSSCARTAAGVLICWSPTTEVASADLTLASAELFADGWCGVTTSGEGYCRFKNRSRVSPEFSWLSPIPIPGGHVFTRISARANTYAAIEPDGHAWVGTMIAGSDGELAPLEPTPFEPDRTFTDVQVANNDNLVTTVYNPIAVCGLTTAGGVICSGPNDMGQRGTGTVDPFGTAAPAPSLAQGLPPVVELSVGFRHVCARTDGGDVYCWGRSTEHQLGYWSDRECAPMNGIYNYCSPTPMKADLPPARRLAAGNATTCVETTTGELACAGWKLGIPY